MNSDVMVLEHDGSESTGRRERPVYTRLTKRLIDVVLVLAMAPIALPLIGLAAALVAFQGGRPFFFQDRVGRDGVIFRIVKIRTMVHDADAALQRMIANDPAAAAEWHSTQKLRDDPRIIRFGHFLRKTSLDELPQLWNVLAGQMSLVGPRPMMPSQRALYPGDAYFRLRPGITGSWQVSARNGSEFASRALYDESYLESLSFGTDAKILVQTVRAVLRGTGV